jgi:hypothetical protein
VIEEERQEPRQRSKSKALTKQQDRLEKHQRVLVSIRLVYVLAAPFLVALGVWLCLMPRFPSKSISLAFAGLKRRNITTSTTLHTRHTAKTSATAAATRQDYCSALADPASRLSYPSCRSRMVSTTTTPSKATHNGAQAHGYATLADMMSSYTSLEIPSDPFAPSLSHLNPTNLPYGYEKPSPDATYSVYLPTIDQSTNDDRAYRLIRLDNGMECMLVSDPTTDKSAAGISVRVGHLSDPENAQGLAHFCEHLLFMGTDKVRRVHMLNCWHLANQAIISSTPLRMSTTSTSQGTMALPTPTLRWTRQYTTSTSTHLLSQERSIGSPNSSSPLDSMIHAQNERS